MKSINNQINKALKQGQVLVLGCHTADSRYNASEDISAISENGRFLVKNTWANGTAGGTKTEQLTKYELFQLINSVNAAGGRITLSKFNPTDMGVVAAKAIWNALAGGGFSKRHIAYLMGYGDSEEEADLAEINLWEYMVAQAKVVEKTASGSIITYLGHTFEKKWGIIRMLTAPLV